MRKTHRQQTTVVNRISPQYALQLCAISAFHWLEDSTPESMERGENEWEKVRVLEQRPKLRVLKHRDFGPIALRLYLGNGVRSEAYLGFKISTYFW